MDITELKPLGASLVLISSALTIIAWAIKFFINHYRQIEDLHPTLSLTKYRWLVWPAIVGNSLYSKLFGSCNDSFFKSFSWRSAFIIFLISIVANSLCLWLILGSAPDNAPTFQYEHLRFLLIDFFIFLVFNYLGDLLSINFTRYLLYKIATQQSNFIRYILLDLGGILLGYIVTLLPVVGVGLYFMMTGNEAKPMLEMGFLGTALHPFFLIVFALSIDSIVLKIVVALSIFSIAVPTLLFLFLSIFTYLLFVVFSTYKDAKPPQLAELFADLLKKVAKILAFIASVLLAAILLLSLLGKQAKAEEAIPKYKLNSLEVLEKLNSLELLEKYNRALAINPNDTAALANRGWVHMNLGRHDKALDDYNRILAIDPNDTAALANRGAVYWNLGQYDKEFEDYNRILAIDPNNTAALNNRGLVYEVSGQYDKALEDYNRILAIDPNHTAALAGRGWVYRNLGQYDKELENYNRIFAINPNKTDALNNRGLIYQSLGQYDKALEDYNSVLAIDPNNTDALASRGLIYQSLGQYDKALEDYNRILAIDPNDTAALNNRGLVYDESGQYDKALEDYNRILAIDPNHTAALNNRGKLNLQTNKLEEAVDDLEQAVAINGELSRYNLAYTYFLLKKPYHSTYWYIDSFLHDVDLSVALGAASAEYLISTLPILRFIFGRNEIEDK